MISPGGRGSLNELNASFAVLMEWERATGQRADGEILLPSGAGVCVCWQELAGAAERVLVKSQADVTLRSRTDLLAEFVQPQTP